MHARVCAAKVLSYSYIAGFIMARDPDSKDDSIRLRLVNIAAFNPYLLLHVLGCKEGGR